MSKFASAYHNADMKRILIWLAARRRRGAGIASDGTAREGWARIADEMRFIALGMLGGSLYFLCENTALEYSTASNVAILVEPTSFYSEFPIFYQS